MMKKYFLYAFLVVLLIVCLAIITYSVTGSKKDETETTIKEVKTEMAEAAAALEDYSETQRKEALAKGRQMLDRIDSRMKELNAELDERWDSMTDRARKEARTTMDALGQQRNELAEWYGGLKHSSEKAWEEVRTGFLESYETLGHSFEQALRQFSGEKED